jgi:hypothetical protein
MILLFFLYVCMYIQNASQVGALDVGYRPGFKPAQLKGAKLLYLLGAVSLTVNVATQ